MPENGMLSFFFNLDFENWSEDNPQSDFRVTYSGNSKLTEIDFPSDLSDRLRFSPVSMKGHEALQIPDGRSMVYPKNFSPEENEDLDKLRNGYFENMLLGHSQPLQEDMYEECVFLDHNVKYPEYTDTFSEVVEKEKNNWIPLFQFGGEEMSRFELGDEGSIYYWIKKDDLTNGNFDNIKAFFQTN